MESFFDLYSIFYNNMIQRLPFISGLFHTSPPYHTGKLWENKIGLQLFRVIGRHFYHLLRYTGIKANTQFNTQLKEEGIIAIENFLSAEDWDKVREEYVKFRETMEYVPYKPGDHPSMQVCRFGIEFNDSRFQHTINAFANNVLLRELASNIVHKNIRREAPSLSYLILKKDNQEYDDDIENLLHADVHYNTAKAFFYLDMVNENNGAYIYAKASHKLTWERLKFEYNMSVRQAKIKLGRKIPPEYSVIRGQLVRNIISEKQRTAMNIKETQFAGNGNTLIMSNNRGFHRRGEFKQGCERAVILINFRHIESSWLRKKLNAGTK